MAEEVKEPLVDRLTAPLPTNIRAYIRGVAKETTPVNEQFFNSEDIMSIRKAAAMSIAQKKENINSLLAAMEEVQKNTDLYRLPKDDVVEIQEVKGKPFKQWKFKFPNIDEWFTSLPIDPDSGDFLERVDPEEYKKQVAKLVKERDDPSPKEIIIGYDQWNRLTEGEPRNIFDIIDTFRNPDRRMLTTIGMGRLDRQEDGSYVLTDRYNFNLNSVPESTSTIYQFLHKAGEKIIGETEDKTINKGYDIRVNIGPMSDWNRMEKPVDVEKLHDELENDEGFSPKVYKDTEGFDTIGFGHKVRPGEDWSKGITREEASKLLEKDTLEARTQAESLPYWGKLNDPQQRAVTNMIFNLGFAGFKKFKKTNKLLEEGRFEDASKEMLNSKWSTQVGARADRLSEMIASA